MRLWSVLAIVVLAVFAALNAFGQEKKSSDGACQAAQTAVADGKTGGCCAKDGAKNVAQVKEAGCCAKDGAKNVAQTKEAGCCAKDGAKNVAQTTDGACNAKDGAKNVAAKTAACATTDGKAGCTAERQKDCASAMPLVTYRIGDRSTCCQDEAASLAKETGKPIQYVLNGKTYDSEATVADDYAVALEQHLKVVLAVNYAVGDEAVQCPNAASEMARTKKAKVEYRLASHTFKDEAAAKKAADHARAEADKVSMKMMVGDQAYECPVSAKDAAGKCGKNVEYAVGESRTPCQKSARVAVAKAKIHAALQTIAADAGA